MSVFLKIPPSFWIASNPLAFAIRDRYPVTKGHTLIITRRVVPTWFDATLEEQKAILELVEVVKTELDRDLSPDGYNVGFNAGAVAGQTIVHLHVHVIPRYKGDMDDPRGGVRHVVPHRGNYKVIAADWSRPPGPKLPSETRTEPLITGQPDRNLLGAVKSLIGRAEQVDIVAAFVRNSGLRLIEPMLAELIGRGGQVRVVAGDYLAITEPDALDRLLTLPERTADWDEDGADGQLSLDLAPLRGTCQTRVVETLVDGRSRSFHPKAWLFSWGRDPKDGVAYVGSSNMSASALRGGVEWNLRVERRLDPTAFDRVQDTFDELWLHARPLTQHWLDNYRLKVQTAARNPIIDIEDYGPDEPVEPRDVQVEALAALAASREEGRQRALIVLATGLGKTFLAAFDIQAFERTCGRAVRVLFIAHRRELLAQAEETLGRVFPNKRFGWFAGTSDQLDGDIVLASIQKLARPANLKKLHPEAFDYVVVDEVHHAAANSYRRVLSFIEPQFLLGLTATPDRADEADILGLFDDHMPYRADLGEGISRGLLVPFVYKGLKDTTDYAPIPWRSGRFSVAELAAAVQTERRMEAFWEAWETTPGTRSLIFCASIDHADYVRDWMTKRGIKVESVHSRPGSYNRQEALEMLAAGRLDALCSVDLFNEGIDVKAVDRVVMLRPTESPVVFLQQLGRGLRTVEGKTSLQVIDFVGNHRVFLDRVRTLLSLSETPTTLREFLSGDAELNLPEGCAIDVELEAVKLLEKLLPSGSRNELVRVYRELRTARDLRPRAGELYRMSLNPASVRNAHKSWFAFVRAEGDLSEVEARAFESGGRWLESLEKTAMTKSFKMVVLQILADADALHEGMVISEIARRCHALIVRTPALLKDLEGVKALDDIHNPDPEQWVRYWRTNPIRAWTSPDRRNGGKPWFALDGDRFVSRLPFPTDDGEAAEALADMTLELVDWRMAIYRRRSAAPPKDQESAFEMKVITNKRHPILHFGSRKDRGRLPSGETDVRLEDGSVWSFKFVKIACNTARPPGARNNQLPDLLYRWFGPDAGKPGTNTSVRFERAPEGWWAKPVGARVVPLFDRGFVTGYEDLRAAAGGSMAPQQGELGATPVKLSIEGQQEGTFAVRASGHSMNGGTTPIRDGDWVVMRWARGQSFGAIEGRVVLVSIGASAEERSFHLKRVVKTEGGGFELLSDNSTHKPIPTPSGATVLARQVGLVRPEELAPSVGQTFDEAELQKAFKLSTAPTPPVSRVDGHLFVMASHKGCLKSPVRLSVTVPDRRPAETAYVWLSDTHSGTWRYAGVGRWLDEDEAWAIPEVDFDTWRRLGKGRSASRVLDKAWFEAAEHSVAVLLETQGVWKEARGRKCRIVGTSARGGVRIDGGPDGFAERTVSALDLGWVLCARGAAKASGAVVDEAYVNRLRYLNGTPRGSTRWIDTGWALVLTE